MPQDEHGNNLESARAQPKWRFSEWDFPEAPAATVPAGDGEKPALGDMTDDRR